MWKDYFYFSGPQRAAILILLFLILAVGLIDLILPLLFISPLEKEDPLFLAEVEAFKNSLVSMDSIRDAEYLRNYSYYNTTDHFVKAANDKQAILFPFNPNELDSSGFRTLGLKPYVVANILKYRRSGGLFKTKESLARIYGLPAESYQELLPYIQIPTHELLIDTTNYKSGKSVATKVLSVELNTADTTELMQIKGIGRAYANAIVRYRKQSGGFITTEQLSEVYAMTPGNLERIKPYCTVNPVLIQRINVNTASVERLKAHPYLNFYQARQIYELRRKKGRLNSIADLSKLSELNDTTLKKIAGYLTFD